MPVLIKKVTGQEEEFNEKKLRRSLTTPGASSETVQNIIEYIKNHLYKFKSTDDIYQYALEQLMEKEPHIAVRYNLKKGLLEFGPTGFPFEKYMAKIFDDLGYQTQLDQIVTGWCVDHEVDIILFKDNEYSIVECKFHNEQFYMTHVQVPMYTQARFQDIEKTWKPANKQERLSQSWVITNTKFTYEAIKYANCKQMKLMSWNYPQDGSLAHLISQHGLYPITALPLLKRHQKEVLLQEGIILCRDLAKNKELLQKIGISDDKFNKLIHECSKICEKCNIERK